MPIVFESVVRSALDKGQVAPVYLLVGDDEVGKAPLLDRFAALVEPGLEAFNLQRVYANEQSIEDIVADARTLPLLGDRRVVIALRCEVFLKPKGRSAASDEDDESEDTAKGGGEAEPSGAPAELERYLAKPVPETCLVLVASDAARNTRLYKQLVKAATVVEFWGLKAEREAKGRGVESALHAGAQYVQERVREAGLRIQRDASVQLLEHAGTDIAVLRNDVERLITYCLGRQEITAADAKAVVSGAVQLDQWALTGAIQEGDAREALRQLQLALEAGSSPWMLLGQIAWFVRARLGERAPERVAPGIDALFRTDTALKSSGGDPQILLERLVVELCGRAGPARRRGR